MNDKLRASDSSAGDGWCIAVDYGDCFESPDSGN